MDELVRYEVDGGIATIVMDDGKVNALSLAMLTALASAFDRAEADEAVVVLAGRDGRFSGGFDLDTIRAGDATTLEMLRAGFGLSIRMLAFPRPVVVACTGHAVAMGLFLLLSGDLRIGAAGPFRLTANEVAIGMPMPRTAIAVCRQRLTPATFDRVVLLAEPFAPDTAAVAGGLLDRVVPAHDVRAEAQRAAEALVLLDATAHRVSKERAREAAVRAVRDGMVDDGFVTAHG